MVSNKFLLSVKDLSISFELGKSKLNAVDKVSFDILPGEIVGVVGESGCGKTLTSLSIMNLIEKPGKIDGGKIFFQDQDVLSLRDKEIRCIRGNEISMIFQEPMTSLNPVYTIGDQVGEMYKIHQNISKHERLDRSIEMLKKVKIPAAEKRVHDYPHQLSGGMRQRVMIAMALACQPKLLIADEPTTALDVTIQAQILSLIKEMQTQNNMSVLLITHDLGVVAELCDHVVVMYAGKVVETGPIKEIFQNPCHPYTKALMKSIPRLDQIVDRLHVIKGSVPSLGEVKSGCRFASRCEKSFEKCTVEHPRSYSVSKKHTVSCYLYQD
ncbi:MAG: peptide ABC transporter ATP-binding protein [Zetaproteobacteria bacterium]|nr:peptide ABC transporter ATP-binding protein [Pseudobdellovibrionaceae bacterium]